MLGAGRGIVHAIRSRGGGVEDDGADRLAVERGGQLPGLEPVDELDFADVARVQHQVEHRALDHQVVEVARQQVLHADARDVRRVAGPSSGRR